MMDPVVHGVAPRPLGAAAPAASAPTAEGSNPRRQRLERATQGFEALFLSYLVKSMHTEEGLFGDTADAGAGNGVLREFADEQLAQALASGGGIGLSSMLLTHLAARIDAAEVAAPAPASPRPAEEKVDQP